MEADDITIFTKEQLETDAAAAASGRKCPRCGLNVPLTVATCPKDGTAIDDTLGEGRKLVGNYEFLEFIGSGGMGVIYKARHPVLKRIVAIKMLHSHLMSDVVTRRFQQEAEAVSGLDHRCIIHVHDFGVSEHGQPYMVMDFVEGKPLSEVLRMGLLPLEAVINIGIQLAEGLNHAHEHGVLHRDLKPSNIMVSDYDCAFPLVKIVDFGIAKIMEGDATKVTQTGELIGTPQYMSPEQCSGGELDARSDIYSVGCVLFEAMTGKPPFSGESMVSVIVDQISKQARTLREVRPDIPFPSRLEDMMARSLSKDPADRQQSMSQLLAEMIEVQKLVTRPERDRNRFFRGLRLNREQRNLALISIASTASLLAVAGSAVMLTEMYNKVRHKNSDEQLKLIGREIDKAVLEERSKVTRFLDPLRLDDHFVRNFFTVDLGVRYIDLARASVTDSSMVWVGMQKDLRFLSLANTGITDAGAMHLQTLTKLSELRLNRTRITDKAIDYILPLQSLETLSLGGTHITDSGVAKLKGLHLKTLDLSHTPITDAAMQSLGSMPTLQGLTLSECDQIKGAQLEQLSKLPSLTVLTMRDVALSDDALDQIGKINSLFDLVITEARFSKDGIAKLASLHRLAGLNLSKTNFETNWVPELAKIPNLVELQLNSTALDGVGLQAIAKYMPKLKKLCIGSTKVKDEDLAALEGMHNLLFVELRNTRVTRSGADRFMKAKQTPGANFRVRLF